MADLHRVPPGQAGKQWLARRLDSGRLAADLLDRKLRILTERERQARELAESTGRQWRDAWQEADRWGLRGAALGGRRELRLSESTEPVRVEIEWRDVMGVRYPAAARCLRAEPTPGSRSPGNAGLVTATAAYAAAVRAAASHAAAIAAAERLATDVSRTRRRRHAIADRWLPTLEQALRERTARLAENALAETVRLRWAADRSTATPSGRDRRHELTG